MSSTEILRTKTRKSETGKENRSPQKSARENWLKALGPGLVTGAADDDPSGIATYSQVGAQFGYGLLWTLLFSYPLMCGIQEVSGHIGRVTGRGIAGNLKKYYHPAFLYSIVILMVAANTFNLGADIGAMGAALSLIAGGPALAYSVLFAAVSVVLETLMPYDKYARVLKWLCMVLLTYFATAFVVHVPWLTALHATFFPKLSLSSGLVMSTIAVLGTTITPYLFFWQAQEEVENSKAARSEMPLKHAPRQAPGHLHRIRVDTYTGMAFSNIVAYVIVLTTACTLHAHGVTNIQTATQAAEALRPAAGRFAFLLFALGIIGTGLLALPVMAGSAAYAVGEAFDWTVGLNRAPTGAKRFYGVLAIAMVLGLGLNFLHLNPIKALFWAAVINGVVAAPIMALMMHIGQSSKVMGPFTLGTRNRILGWAATIVMVAAAAALLLTIHK